MGQHAPIRPTKTAGSKADRMEHRRSRAAPDFGLRLAGPGILYLKFQKYYVKVRHFGSSRWLSPSGGARRLYRVGRLDAALPDHFRPWVPQVARRRLAPAPRPRTRDSTRRQGFDFDFVTALPTRPHVRIMQLFGVSARKFNWRTCRPRSVSRPVFSRPEIPRSHGP